MKKAVLFFLLLFQILLTNGHGAEKVYRDGEVLIKYRTPATVESKASLVRRHSMSLVRSFHHLNVHHLRLPEGTDVLQAVENLKREEDVEYAEPNYIRKPLSTLPNDQGWLGQWGMAKIGMVDAWTLNRGSSSVTVAVVDTGVDYNHPDLAANIWTNDAEASGVAGVDDDGNGRIDDLRGWNFYCPNGPCIGDNNPMDDEGHGTHVAGIIGAVGNNGLGVTGVNWTVKVMPLKFMNSVSGAVSDAVAAIRYAVEKGAKVINASYGYTTFSQTEYNAIEDAGNSGVLFVAAAGNNGADNDGSVRNYPSSYGLSNIIAVASSDSDDTLASSSNYGATTVDLAAPGVKIESTVAGNLSDLSGVVVIPGAANTHYRAKRLEYAGQIPVQGVTGRICYCGYGATRENFPSAVRENIALIQRGSSDGISSVTFAEKVSNAMNAGAIAAIIFDNVGGEIAFAGTLGSTGNWIPAIAVTKSDGQFLTTQDGSSVSLISSYDIISGTSMATPFVSGAAGLLLAEKHDLSVSEIKDVILRSVDAVPSLAGKVVSSGRLNVYRAMETIGRPPFQVKLQAGWNFVSFPKLPADKTVEQALAGGILPQVKIIWGYDGGTQQWQKWKRGDAANNTLKNLGFGKGYWVFMDAAGTINLSGWSPPVDTKIHLYDGWNLIGYSGTDGALFDEELGSIDGRWSAIWNWTHGQWSARQAFIALPPAVQPLSLLYQGKAYWVKISPGKETDWTQ